MMTDQITFLEDMLESTELLYCTSCGEETLHAHEEVLTRTADLTEVLMRCTQCMETRTWIDE
ncbi:hypothetical protein F1C16_21585 (plasmid) [Hymenobacter sp. NBH84]|uniref:hypothetical protein n=1 Tax=Hymenobacter sp. NBH84 TaxID=2596915 RepID=UPI001626240D|nr:hypothetical protein [Hymenobacter sp. NBH84]QNE42221.1 hypothetical protein F1C16_21585 [Hymenobacter sp. NBH84]